MIAIIVLYWIKLFFKPFVQMDPDFGWHIYLGKHYVETGQVANKFIGYNYFQDLPYVDHEWLSNIAMYKAYDTLGYLGLAIIFLLILTVSLFFIRKKTVELGASKLALLFSLIILLFPVSLLYNTRPYIFLFPLVPLLLIIEKWKNIRARLLVYLVISVIGINFHGGVLLVLISAALLELRPKNSLRDNFVIMLSFVLIALTSVLSTPYQGQYFGIVKEYFHLNSYANLIQEWLPFYRLPEFFLQTFLPLAVSVLVFAKTKLWRKIPLNQSLFLAFYLFAALRSVRFFPLFFLAFTPYLALGFTEIERSIDAKTKRWASITGVSVLIFSAILGLITNEMGVIKQSFPDPRKSPSLPNEVLNFIDNKGLSHSVNLLNPFELGGYILWTHPDIPIFLDGRGPQTPIANSTLLGEYITFTSENELEIQHKLEIYEIGAVLIEKPTGYTYSSNKKQNLLKRHGASQRLESILLEEKWSVIFEDDNYLLYQKPETPSQAGHYNCG